MRNRPKKERKKRRITQSLNRLHVHEAEKINERAWKNTPRGKTAFQNLTPCPAIMDMGTVYPRTIPRTCPLENQVSLSNPPVVHLHRETDHTIYSRTTHHIIISLIHKGIYTTPIHYTHKKQFVCIYPFLPSLFLIYTHKLHNKFISFVYTPSFSPSDIHQLCNSLQYAPYSRALRQTLASHTQIEIHYTLTPRHEPVS